MINSRGCSNRWVVGALLAGLLLPAQGMAGRVYMAAASHENGSYFDEVDALVDVPEPRVRALLTDYNNLRQVNPAIY